MRPEHEAEVQRGVGECGTVVELVRVDTEVRSCSCVPVKMQEDNQSEVV